MISDNLIIDNYNQIKIMIDKNTNILNKIMNHYDYYNIKYTKEDDNNEYEDEEAEYDEAEDEDAYEEDGEEVEDAYEEDGEVEDNEADNEADEEEQEDNEEDNKINLFKMNYISKIINNSSEDDIKKIVQMCSKKIFIPRIYTKSDLNDMTIYNTDEYNWNRLLKKDFTENIDDIIYNYLDE
jgi:hypothetical protein